MFSCLILPNLLYNCALWTLSQTLTDVVNVWHRKKLRTLIGFTYPQRISNTALYARTEQTPLSQVCRKRRLLWFGHLVREGAELSSLQPSPPNVNRHNRHTTTPRTTRSEMDRRRQERLTMHSFFTDIGTTPSSVAKYNKRLKLHKAAGLDGITNELLKILGPSICGPLSLIFNLSFSSGVFPSVWKRSVVVPIYKNKGRLH